MYTLVKSPRDELSLSNVVVLNNPDLNNGFAEVTRQTPTGAQSYHYLITHDAGVKQNEMGCNKLQRDWMGGKMSEQIQISQVDVKRFKRISKISTKVDFLSKQRTTQAKFETEKMAKIFSESFKGKPFSVNQLLLFKLGELPYLKLCVSSIETLDALSERGAIQGANGNEVGVLLPDAMITFERDEGSTVMLTGKNKCAGPMPSLIDPNWDFSKIGVGGLDKEFNAIFRRAFASRLFPPELVDELGLKHSKGILLYGPPGTGKTLMARQIGKMLNAREPKIINGPEILNKFVGESEANIRKLFEDAEAEQARDGINSGLHIIIFDEIDAICKQRGSTGGGTGVHDTVVNQLLSKIDGVEQLNNILVIGMTNRKDMIDDALLRPGRLEVQMEISLPDEHGRLQILKIHTNNLAKANKLNTDVNLDYLAKETKNYSGAEIEGLVRAAATTAMNRLVKVDGKITVDNMDGFKVTKNDFEYGMLNDIKPSFGANTEDFETYIAQGIYEYGEPIKNIIEDGQLLIKQTRDGKNISLVSVLLEGPKGSGKTALAADLAVNSAFPFVKFCSPENMIGFSENAKCQAIKKVFDDAYKSELSCVVVDDIERLIEYVPIGPRFSNVVLQTVMVLMNKKLKKGKKLLVIGTTSCREVIDQLDLLQSFNTVVHVPSVTKHIHLRAILEHNAYFTSKELDEIEAKIKGKGLNVSIKKLLSLAEMAMQVSEGESKATKFFYLLIEQHCLL